MIRSIKYFLLISLLVSITIASAINGVGNYLLDEKVVQPYLDAQLIKFASLIQILSQSTSDNAVFHKNVVEHLIKQQPLIYKKFLFQVWNKNGTLLMHAPDEFTLSLKDAPPGFSDTNAQGNEWRIYSTYDPKLNLKIVVGELYNIRRQLADDIARSNANILLITYPLFGLLIWFIISFALRSITRVTNEISNRASTFLEPVQLGQIPIEIKPLVAELNRLFIRLKLAFLRNKRFASDAAHELRTPLAALKTHVQVALNTDNDIDRKNALNKVVEGVDRSSHVIAQLLTLSRLGEEEVLSDVRPVDLHKLAVEIIALIAPHALEKNTEIELAPSPPEPIVLGNDIALGILIRNIVDNAIRYTPEKGCVKVEIIDDGAYIILRVIDSGPGIPINLRERVFERFYRILGTQATGSGLGLAIVGQIAVLHHAKIKLATPQSGVGLQFDVAFPKYRA